MKTYMTRKMRGESRNVQLMKEFPGLENTLADFPQGFFEHMHYIQFDTRSKIPRETGQWVDRSGKYFYHAPLIFSVFLELYSLSSHKVFFRVFFGNILISVLIYGEFFVLFWVTVHYSAK